MKGSFENYISTLESGGRPKGGALSSGDVISLGAEHINGDGGLTLKNLKFIPKIFYEQLNKGKVQCNDILIVKDGATTGKVAFVNGQFYGKEVAINEHLFLLRVNEQIFSKYLFYFLYSKVGQNQILSDFRGSTVGGISRNFTKYIKLPIPDLCVQREIAQILEEADIARQKRKAVSALTDQFLQSTFLSMFGDPVSNPKSWDKYPIRSLAAKYSDGPFGSNLKSEHYAQSGILVIRLENIGINLFKESSLSYISEDHYRKLEKYTCLPGDVVIGTMGDPNLRACILPKHFDVAINKADCVLFRANKEKVVPEFISYLLNMPSFVGSVSNLVLGQTRGRISMGRLSTVEIIVPPIQLQQKFASIVADTEQLREKQKQSELELENLFQSLLQKYFS